VVESAVAKFTLALSADEDTSRTECVGGSRRGLELEKDDILKW
jgi:hypothetical protein